MFRRPYLIYHSGETGLLLPGIRDSGSKPFDSMESEAKKNVAAESKPTNLSCHKIQHRTKARLASLDTIP